LSKKSFFLPGAWIVKLFYGRNIFQCNKLVPFVTVNHFLLAFIKYTTFLCCGINYSRKG